MRAGVARQWLGGVLVLFGCATATAGEWVADNDAGAPVYSETGPFTTSTSTGYAGGTYRYMTAPGAAASATWRPNLPERQSYSLFAAYRQGSNRTTSGSITVTHTSGTSVLWLDQKGDGTGVMMETLLGDFVFDAGTSGSVRMDNIGAPGVFIADAMIWRTPTDYPPDVTSVTRSLVVPTAADTVAVTATVTDNSAVTSAALVYTATPPGGAVTVPACDDGLHGDGAAGDRVYGAAIPPQTTNTAVSLRFLAWDDAGQETSSPAQNYVVGRRAGSVYVVMSSDTSVWGFSGGPNPTIPWAVFQSRTGVLSKVYRPAFRNAHADSQGVPFKITWFMHGGAWFRAGVNSTPVSALHHIRRNWGPDIALWGDALEYHFHHYVYDAEWLQAPTFAETIPEYEWVMSQMMIDERLFVAAFRSGWNYMDDSYQQYLERWMPFRMEGVQANWIPYHPGFANWKTPGTMKGWEARHIYMKDLKQAGANLAFSAANSGADQVMVIWFHQNEDDYPEQIAAVDGVLRNAAAAYPAVQFRYCSAREAMQRYTGHATGNVPPPLAVTPAIAGNLVSVTVTTADDIYQEQPWVAARKYSGEYLRLETLKTGSGTWQFGYSRAEVDRVVVGVSDIWGNDSLAEVVDGSRRWAIQSEYAAASPFQVDFDTSPTRVRLAKSAGNYRTTGTLTFEHQAEPDAEWGGVILTCSTPAAGTNVRCRIKAADTREALEAAPWSGYMGGGVTPLAPAARGKFFRAEVLLEGTTYATSELLSLEVTRATPAAGMPDDLWRLY